MPAPKKPNTAAATAAVRRRGQETMAAKLREVGWTCTPPEQQESHYGVAAGVQGGGWVNAETGVPGSYEPDGDERHHNSDQEIER